MSDSTATALAALPGAEATAAWSFLVERHGPDVWRVVRSLHRHHQEAEDAYQDAWLHLRCAAAAFRPGPGGEAAARAWVLRVACTRTLDGLRRMKVRRHAELLPEAEPAAPPPSEPVDPAVRERLHAALERLPDQLRQAVLLHVVGGVTYEDLAVQLRTTVNNLRVRVHRALARLREDARLPEGEGSAYGGSALGLLLVPPGPPPVAPAFSSLPAGQFAAGAAAATTSTTTVVAIAVAAGAGLAIAVLTAVVLTRTPTPEPSMPIAPVLTALAAAATVAAAATDDFERASLAMNGYGPAEAKAEIALVAAPEPRTGKTLRIAWPAQHGDFVDLSYDQARDLPQLGGGAVGTVRLQVWATGDGAAQAIAVRLIDAKDETFQWRGAVAAGPAGWREIVIPIAPATNAGHWGGSTPDGVVKPPLRLSGYAVGFTSKDSPGGAVYVDDVEVAGVAK